MQLDSKYHLFGHKNLLWSETKKLDEFTHDELEKAIKTNHVFKVYNANYYNEIKFICYKKYNESQYIFTGNIYHGTNIKYNLTFILDLVNKECILVDKQFNKLNYLKNNEIIYPHDIFVFLS